MIPPMPSCSHDPDHGIARLQRSAAAKRRQQVGAAAEHLVEHRLRAMGLVLVEKVEVGCRVVRGQRIYTKPVSGDFRAVAPGGRSVLVEVKARDTDRLATSDLETHQRRLLTEHAEAGGASLLAWFRPDLGELVLMEWAAVAQAFAPRASLAWDAARALAIQEVATPAMASP